jgi:acetoacetyl-CoA synthetase
LFFYSTTGWMMWNTLMNGPLLNATAVLFDGHPSHPDPGKLWQLAEAAGATTMGANPTVTQIMARLNIVPKDLYDLRSLESVLLVGSPATPEAFAWVYDNVKADVWVTSQSGGTEFCSGLLCGAPEFPVRAGMIDAPGLGVDARVFNDAGEQVFDQPGELVIAKPMPSMPLFLWGDNNYERYAASYFERWPSVWLHGDSAQINRAGGCFLFGRSDATLNRFGVRIGSAEIYRTLEKVDGVADSLVVCIEEAGGNYFMPLFVRLAAGRVLDEPLKAEIVRRLRTERSPRHVPDVIVEAPDIPMTITGKKMEVPVRRLLMGQSPEKVFSVDATRNPGAMQWYVDYARARGKAA